MTNGAFRHCTSIGVCSIGAQPCVSLVIPTETEKRMGNLNAVLNKLAKVFEGVTEELRDLADDLPNGVAGHGEENDDPWVEVPARNGINDDTVITMKSGDLREVIDAYRRMVRYAREGKIPTQEQRNKLHPFIKKVKHLVRKPAH